MPTLLQLAQSYQNPVSSLPMRNWNSFTVSPFIALVKYPAYLWGIETPDGRGGKKRKRGIQPTYEELKLDDLSYDLLIDKRIQPTYEELKPVKVKKLSPFKGGIQPTYEELKPGGALYAVRRLRQYPAYLWGIETGWFKLWSTDR